MKRYHFSLGDSNDGPVGFCAAVFADTKKQAVEKLRAILPDEQAVEPLDSDEDGEVEYINTYFNPDAVTEADVDKEYEVCPTCHEDRLRTFDTDPPGYECGNCKHTWVGG